MFDPLCTLIYQQNLIYIFVIILAMYISPLLLVPPQIFSFPQFWDQIESFSNEQVTLTVTFQSHQEATTIVRWFMNDIPINSTNLNTQHGLPPNAILYYRAWIWTYYLRESRALSSGNREHSWSNSSREQLLQGSILVFKVYLVLV